MIRFYLPVWKEGQMAELSAEESKHCITVLRHQEGDVIHAVDGRGHLLECSIMSPDPSSTAVQVNEVLESESDPPVLPELIVAPTKQMSRMEWMVEKCTEIGIRKISFLLSRYSERPSISKWDRLERKVLSAMKQSQRLWLPELEGMRSLDDVLEESGDYEGITLAASAQRSAKWMGEVLDTDSPTRVIIGPEGGFHDDELEQFDEYNLQSVSLGPSVLRTETAGVYVSSVWSCLIQER